MRHHCILLLQYQRLTGLGDKVGLMVEQMMDLVWECMADKECNAVIHFSEFM